MKALTLWQPWASLVIWGWKIFETRAWSTEYRGRLAIHAAKRENASCADLWKDQTFFRCLASMGYTSFGDLPRGVVLGHVELFDVYRAEWMREQVGVMENTFGDFSFGRFAWLLKSPVRFATPIPTRGYQGLWNWEPPGELKVIQDT